MHEGWPILDLQTLASGLVGLFLLGALFKRAFDGYIETKARVKQTVAAPLLNAVSITWDRDQQERFLHLIERLVTATETSVRVQRISLRRARLAQDTFSKRQGIILERLEDLINRADDSKSHRRK